MNIVKSFEGRYDEETIKGA